MTPQQKDEIKRLRDIISNPECWKISKTEAIKLLDCIDQLTSELERVERERDDLTCWKNTAELHLESKNKALDNWRVANTNLKEQLTQTKLALESVNKDCTILEQQIADLLHFKSAYSRALNFVCEQHYPAIPAKEHDDPYFKSVDGNGCAVDILIARLNRLEACHKAEASLSGEQAKEYGQVLYGLCSTNGGQSWNLFNLAHATVENREKALKQIGVEI